MTTAAHSGHQAQAAISMLERLSVDLMVHILEFVELPERLRLSMCSTKLLKVITTECTPLWVDIVFYSLKHATSLTDDMLAALLTRVNARNVTKYLDLDGCSKIDGRGLAPLRHSRVLERVDLRTGDGDTDDDDDGDTDDDEGHTDDDDDGDSDDDVRYVLDETGDGDTDDDQDGDTDDDTDDDDRYTLDETGDDETDDNEDRDTDDDEDGDTDDDDRFTLDETRVGDTNDDEGDTDDDEGGTDDDEDGDTDDEEGDIDDDRYILDETVVMDILRTMLPYELFDVMFYPVDVSNDRLLARKLFFREIRAAMHRRAIQQRIGCAACNSPVCEESRQIVANELGLPSTRCYICHEHFCRTSTCPMALKQCRDCEDAFCESCDAVEQCSLCACHYCDECREVSPACSICQGKFCGDCRDVHTCECCKTTVCEECAAEEH